MARVSGLAIINRAVEPDFGTIGQALQALELPWMFAGREQLLRNLTGAGVDDAPQLQNVGKENPRFDPHSKQLLIGHLRDSKDPKGDVKFWKHLVPDWAPGVKAELARKGVPFSVELLYDPAINVNGDYPLFAAGEQPATAPWVNLGAQQRGERGFYRSLNAIELMLEVWPCYYAFFHRKAGAPAPFPGLTFGVREYDSKGVAHGSPLKDTDAYDRWAKAGYPE